MQTPQFVSQLTENEGVRSTVEAIATHPRVAAATLVGNGSILAAVKVEAITGYLSLFSLLVGGLTTSVVCAYWMVKLAREWAGLKKDLKE